MEIKFVNTIPEKIILAINERINYAARIAKEIKASYSGVCHTIIGLIELGLINQNPKGRKVYLTLTEKGKRIQELLKKLKEETWDNQIA